MIEEREGKKGRMKMEHLVDLLISLEINYYQYLTNDYGITVCLYYL